MPHNDVLIFGTDTKIALDVSTPVAGGGAPEVTIGYKRREAVYMPLVVNGAGAGVQPQDPPSDPVQYNGSSGEGATARTDAYSVFASFGANLRGTGSGTQAEAAAGLAQFFATGIAAQHLGANSRVAEALSIQPAGAAAANARAAAAEADAQRERALMERLRSEIGDVGIGAASKRAIRALEVEKLAAARIVACAEDRQAYTAYLERVAASSTAAEKVKTLVAELQVALNTSDDVLEVIRGQGDEATVIALQCNSGGT